MTGGVAETADGARTVEALRLQQRRIRRTDEDAAASWRAERYTLFLRTVWFPAVEIAYVVPVAATLLVGGLLYARGVVTLGEVTAVTLYVQALIDPLDRLLSWLDELQVGGDLARPARRRRAGAAGPRRQRPASRRRSPGGFRGPLLLRRGSRGAARDRPGRAARRAARDRRARAAPASRRSAGCWPACTRPRAVR